MNSSAGVADFHTQTDQTSIARFIEDNWLVNERIGGGSFDSMAGSIQGMFDFSGAHCRVSMRETRFKVHRDLPPTR